MRESIKQKILVGSWMLLGGAGIMLTVYGIGNLLEYFYQHYREPTYYTLIFFSGIGLLKLSNIISDLIGD